MVTSPAIPGYEVERVLGIVQGMTARTRGVGGKIWGGLQSITGGEVTAFTHELEKARAETIDRLKTDALKLGANAVISVDFETTEVFDTVVLVSAYGTAVVVTKKV